MFLLRIEIMLYFLESDDLQYFLLTELAFQVTFLMT